MKDTSTPLDNDILIPSFFYMRHTVKQHVRNMCMYLAGGSQFWVFKLWGLSTSQQVGQPMWNILVLYSSSGGTYVMEQRISN